MNLILIINITPGDSPTDRGRIAIKEKSTMSKQQSASLFLWPPSSPVPKATLSLTVVVAALALPAVGCGSDTSGSPEAQAQATVKAYIVAEIGKLLTASKAIHDAAPAPDADGWNDTADASAVTNMKTRWKAARIAYEHVEGAIAVLFPDLDMSTDERYDGFLESGPDDNLFDGEGVTGIHAIERVLWAGKAPASVVTFESSLTGYKAAAFPATVAEATAFRDGLTMRLVTDVTSMQTMFAPLTLPTNAAFRGVIGSLGEQIEKIDLAAMGQEESRYAQHTLADMRANLEGGRTTYTAFQGWVKATGNGAALDADILAGFDRVNALYTAVSGEALPAVPVGFDPDAPTTAQLATPYGTIWTGLKTESDGTAPASLVSKMTAVADALGIPQLQ
jgi:iron uptake system component EfeO